MNTEADSRIDIKTEPLSMLACDMGELRMFQKGVSLEWEAFAQPGGRVGTLRDAIGVVSIHVDKMVMAIGAEIDRREKEQR
jgi:hypothetical protein